MRKFLPGLLLLMFAIPGSAAAQTVAYVSNLTGQQVLAVAANGSTSVVLYGPAFNSATFTPEDLVVGPDGKLYICDVGSTPGIWRFDPAALVVAGVNPLKIVSFAANIIPVGPTFSGSDDLYVNTRGFGVYSVQGAAATGGIPAGGAVQVPSAASWGGGGGGLVVDEFGRLLVVDRPGNKVLAASPTIGPYPNFVTTPTSLFSVSAPVGITTNTCGDALVASGTTIQRFGLTKDPLSGTFGVQARGPYIDFGGTNLVQYLERDAANNLYVATNSKSAGGIVWKITPSGSDPISSCSAGVAQQLVSLKALSQGQSAILSSSQTQAVGVAIPPTNYTATATFSDTQPSATFNFGHYSLTLTYTQIPAHHSFQQQFTAIMSKPADVRFQTPATFPAGTVGMRFPSLGGFVIQFQTASEQNGGPVAGTDYVQSTTSFQFTLAFADPIQGVRDPGVAHSSDDSVTGVYTNDVTGNYWVLKDPASSGSGANWGCKYVPFDEPFQVSSFTLPLKVQLNQPALSNNPLFNVGQNFTVSITVTDANNVAVPGLQLRISAAFISSFPFQLQTVQAGNNATVGNLLNDNGNGKYSIGIDTSLFTAGTGAYQFTIFGQGFPPFVFVANFSK